MRGDDRGLASGVGLENLQPRSPRETLPTGCVDHDEVSGCGSTERPYRLMIEHMQEGAVTISFETSAILYCNHSFARMLGVSRIDLLGRRITDIVRPAGEVSVTELLDGVAPCRGEFEHSTAAGGRLPVTISATSVVGEGEPTRCLVVGDRTEREDNERLRRVRHQLEEANRRKNEFIAMLGHELRNPLAPIRQAVEALQEDEVELSMQRVDSALQVIERQVEHMTRLVDDLLDAGRITQGTINVEPTRVALAEIVEGAIESVHRLVNRRRHCLRLQLPSQPVYVSADAVRLTQVFANLLSNAAKYTPENGNIELEVRAWQHQVRVVVRDDGQGIAADLLPQLFEPFVQGPAGLARRGGGLGVGLTLVRRLVELHGGRVWATSQGPGKGSEFMVDLPRMREELASSPEPATEVEPTQRHRILVVDDNEDAAEMLALVLRGRGHMVETAFDGPDALEKVAVVRPTVVCLDIGLPGMDGFAVARRLRDRPDGASLILLAVTGYGQDSDRAAAREAGFDELIVKPTTAEILEQAIARIGEGGGGSQTEATR
jgi:PAS domain S-box-containing protein